MGILDLFAALEAAPKMGFRLAWLRARHARHGHPADRGVLVEKLHSQLHPHTSADHIFTVNVMKCEACGLTYLDAGLESRKH